MSRPFFERRPTENQAVGRTTDRPAPTAPVFELRHRLVVAVRNDDGAGLRLLVNLMARASA